MSTAELTCGHCGAGIHLPSATRFATCAHCGARLAIHRTPAASYTEVLHQVRTRAAESAQELERAQLQHDLEKIDLAWQMRQHHVIGSGPQTTGNLPVPGQIPPTLAMGAVSAG